MLNRMYSDIYRKFSITAAEKCGIVKDVSTRVVAAVSGGSDSICLLILLSEYLGRENVICAHFNHKLRGDEADRDENFTRQIADKLGITFICGEEDVGKYALENKLGTEEAARKLRYEFLRNAATEAGSGTLIATGHNAGDRIETVIFNMARGSSIDGLKGIDYRTKDGIVRPILDITKAETEEVCEHYGITPMYDSTNADTVYTRNMIRNDVLPYLKNVFGETFEEHVLHLSDSAAADSDFLNIQTIKAYEECCSEYEEPFRKITLDTDKYAVLHAAMKKRLVRYILSKVKDENGNLIFPEFTGIYSSMIESACELADNVRTGKRIDLPLGVKCITEAYGLSFIHETCLDRGQQRISERLSFLVKQCEGTPDQIANMVRNKKENQEIFDADKIISLFGCGFKIELRTGMPGDHFTPFGAQGGKSLNKFYIDKKISKCEREYMKVAAVGNEILWVPNIRRSAVAPIDKNTTRVIILECISNTEVNG